MIIHGDCLDVMAGMEPESVDAIVTDPPYNLTSAFNWGTLGEDDPNGTLTGRRSANRQRGGFMGKSWDGTGIAFRREMWEAAYRVAKPSAYLLAFGGTRTVHRMTVALEDAGWIIRDMLVWAYASGFPKSKASLKPAWEPIVMARKPGPLRMLAIDECRIGFASDDDREGAAALQALRTKHPGGAPTYGGGKGMPPPVDVGVNASGRWPANVLLTATEDGRAIFDGGVDGVVGGGEARGSVGSGPRPLAGAFGPMNANEYPDEGTYSRFFQLPKRYNETCQECGRVSSAEPPSSLPNRSAGSAPRPAPIWPGGTLGSISPLMGSLSTSGTELTSWSAAAATTPPTPRSKPLGTSPESEPPSSLAKSPDAASPATDTTTTTAVPWTCGTCAEATTLAITRPSPEARNYPFAFLIPKADRNDREPVLGGLPVTERSGESTWAGECNVCGSRMMLNGKPTCGHDDFRWTQGKARANHHPTVKPTELMRHLVRLVTPQGGTVLDPFLGSGSTGLACELEGFPWIGIEKEAEYVAIAEARLNGTQRGLGLVG